MLPMAPIPWLLMTAFNNPDELAFYGALTNNESVVHELSNVALKMIAHELTHKLRKSTTVDWQVRDIVRAKLLM